MEIAELYRAAYGRAIAPYPFQRAIAESPETDLLIAPTGLGKTAAVTLGWTWRRLTTPETTPRRLVWCLPMRTLVEQTSREADAWMRRLCDIFTEAKQVTPKVHVIMGGAVDKDWRLRPEDPAILVGTHDMLLSRALMRGYGMSRFGWPIDFGLLHTDALWVYDEVQLMGAGLATSAQLEAFRRRPVWRHHGLSRSLWISATLDPDWLKTAEFRSGVPNPIVHRWDDGNPPEPEELSARLDAIKRLGRAQTVLTDDGLRKPQIYARAVAREVAAAHREGTTTLVIVNTVRRAQTIYAALAGELASTTARLLLHSRYRPPDRRALEQQLRAGASVDRVVVATQAVEAGVDLTSTVLFTELAPWSSLVQRFGRCNRGGECNGVGGSDVYWIDVPSDETDATSRPYESDQLRGARERLATLREVSPRNLPPPSPPPPAAQVIRPKDFAELFDTDSDLSGYDLDISAYIRDADDMSVSLFWRAVGEASHVTAERPLRDEFCSAPIGRDLKDWLEADRSGEAAPVYVEDPLASTRNAWIRWDRSGRRLRPGLTLLLDVTMGGYDAKEGFLGAQSKTPVQPIVAEILPGSAVEADDTDQGETTESDPQSFGFQTPVFLEVHLCDVATEARRIGHALSMESSVVEPLARAGAWHDLGKAYEPFQVLLGRAPGDARLAKSFRPRGDGSKRPEGLRKFFRHELASALGFLRQHDGEPDADLVAYLIAAHHGKVRMGLRALPDEVSTDPALRIARGVQDGDALPEIRCESEISSAITLDLGLMEMGENPNGRASWAARAQALLADLGPFRLAYLEALIRMADWRASAASRRPESSDE